MTETPVFHEQVPEDNRAKETEDPYAEGMAEIGKIGFVSPERFGQIVAAGHQNGIGTLDILTGARAVAEHSRISKEGGAMGMKDIAKNRSFITALDNTIEFMRKPGPEGK